MPPIHFLNPPPHPFWTFVSDMENHPFFAPQGDQPRETEQAAGPSNSNDNNNNNNNNEKEKANVEDPPEVDPSTVRPQHHHEGGPGFRARERCHRRRGSSPDDDGVRERRRGGGCGGARGWGRHGPRGFGGPHPPPPAGPGGPFGQGFPFAGPPPHHQHHPGGFWAGPRGRGGFGPRGEHMHGRHRPHHPLFPFGPGHGPRGQSPPAGGPGGFNLGEFLNNLGERIGMDLSGAAQNLGLDRFMPGNGSGTDADFEPKVDIFDLTENYVIHLSLPGAKKSDIGVDWDGEHSALRIAGVVHRPDVDEAMLERLVVDGRKHETGLFEKMIRLGTRRDPAVVDVSHITAKMRDGVLVVTVPKSERANENREVPIAKSASASPVRDAEKDMIFFDADADHHMTDTNDTDNNNVDGEIQMIDRNTFESSLPGRAKQVAAEKAQDSRASSATVEEEKQQEKEVQEAEPEKKLQEEQEQEQLPTYHPVERHDNNNNNNNNHSDWENFDSESDDEEGEFVKINVD